MMETYILLNQINKYKQDFRLIQNPLAPNLQGPTYAKTLPV